MKGEPIRSLANAHVRKVRALRDRGDPDLALIEGVRLLEESLAAGLKIEEALVTPRAETTYSSQLEQLRSRRVPLHLVEERLLAKLSELETSQGVLALVRRPTFREEELFQGTPLVVVLCGLQNPGNVGAIVRTAEAAGASGVFLTQGSPDPLSSKALRGSMGSAFRVPHLAIPNTAEVRERLKARGLRLIATSRSGGSTYDGIDWRGPSAVFFGSEGAGLAEDVVAGTDINVSIPLKKPVDSLNVGAAAAVILFEAARQRRSDSE